MAQALDRQLQMLRLRAGTLRRQAMEVHPPDAVQGSSLLLGEALDALELALEALQAAVSGANAQDWQAALDTIDEGVCLMDLAGTVLACNQAMADLVACSPGDLIGRSCCQMMHGSPEPLEDCPLLLMRRSCRRESLVVQSADRWLRVTVAPLVDEADHLAGAVHIVSDVTQQRQAREVQDSLAAQLRQAQKMEAMGRLVGGVAHDFNNLLTPILGYSQRLIRRLHDDDPLRPDAQQILRAGQRAAALSRQLLMFSRRQAPHAQPLDLNKLVSNMERMLTRIIGENVQLSTQLSPAPCLVRADPGQIEQVIMNLALNGHDAMAPLGGGTLTIRTEAAPASGDAMRGDATQSGSWVRLSVTDTGVGMDAEVKDHLFEPFFTTKTQGTGLGLAVVQSIVREHQGRIEVASAPGQGSVFQVYFPALIAAGVESEEDESIGQGEPPGRGETVLVVEDDDWVRQFTAQALRRSGYIVSEAETLAQARAALAQDAQHTDLVFTDVVLADGNGLDLATELFARWPDVGLLLSSGYTDDRSRLAAIRQRNLSFIQKPYTVPDLLQAIRQALERRGAETSAS